MEYEFQLSCKESLIRKEGETLGKMVFDMREKERSYYRTVEAVNKVTVIHYIRCL